MKKENTVVKNNKVILNSIQDLQRLPLLLLNNLRERFQIKFGMTSLFNNNGFTLIELLVVVLIIGILAAVAAPQYQKAVQKARIAQILPLMKAIKNANTVFHLQTGFYSANPDDWDIALPSDITRIHLGNDNIESILYFSDGSHLSVWATPTEDVQEERILFNSEKIPVHIWLSLSQDKWMCYPNATARGVQLCKNLGCESNITTATWNCVFSF